MGRAADAGLKPSNPGRSILHHSLNPYPVECHGPAMFGAERLKEERHSSLKEPWFQ